MKIRPNFKASKRKRSLNHCKPYCDRVISAYSFNDSKKEKKINNGITVKREKL